MNGARLHIYEGKDLSYDGDTKYVKVSFLPDSDKSARTVVARRYGRNKAAPIWDEMLRLKPDPQATGLALRLYDEGMFNDDLIGECAVDFTNFSSVSGVKKSYPLNRGGKIYAAISVAHLQAAAEASRKTSSSSSSKEPSTSSGSGNGNGPSKSSSRGRRRRTTVAANAHRTLVIEVIKATGLVNMNTFTAMNPYAVASLGGSGTGGSDYSPRAGDYSGLASRGQTEVHEGGGTDPLWDDGVNEVWRNKLMLAPNPRASTLTVEVWNQDVSGDERVGACDISFFHHSGGAGGASLHGERVSHRLDTGGTIECAVSFMEPVNESNISKGLRVTRGPHWTHGNKYDGGSGKLGTVDGYRSLDGSIVGRFPKNMESQLAVVTWDSPSDPMFATGVYPIGKGGRYDLALGGLLHGKELNAQYRAELAKRHAEDLANEQDGREERRRKQEADKAERETREREEKAKRKTELQAQRLKHQQEAEEERQAALTGDEEKRLLMARKRAVREAAAAVTLQCFYRVLVAEHEHERLRVAHEAELKVRKLAAVIIIQRRARTCVCAWHFARTRWLAATLQRLARGVAVRREVLRRMAMAMRLQKHFRGARLLQLVSSVNNGALCVEIESVNDLPDTGAQMWGSMEPYVKVTLLPSRISRRTKRVRGGGQHCMFHAHHANQLVMGMSGRDTSSVLVEVWAESALMGDAMLCSAQLELPFHTMHTAETTSHALSPEGEVRLRMYLVPNKLFLASSPMATAQPASGPAHPSAPGRGRVPGKKHGSGDGGGGGGGGGSGSGGGGEHGSEGAPPEAYRRITVLVGGKGGGVAAMGSSSPGWSFLLVEVHRGTGLCNTQIFTKQDPRGFARTAAVDGGGTAPDWDEHMSLLAGAEGGKAVGGAVLALEPDADAESLQIQVWNENSASADDFIGMCEVPLRSKSADTNGDFRLGARRSLTLDTGGTLEVTFHALPGAYPWLDFSPAQISAGLGLQKAQVRVVAQVHRAEALADVAAFGAQDVYAMLEPCAMDAGWVAGVAQTMVCPDGGSYPLWDEALSHAMVLTLTYHGNELLPNYSACKVKVVLMEEGVLVDSIIGEAVIDLFQEPSFQEKEKGISLVSLADGRRQWHKINTGGRMRVSTYAARGTVCT